MLYFVIASYYFEYLFLDTTSLQPTGSVEGWFRRCRLLENHLILLVHSPTLLVTFLSETTTAYQL